MKKLGKFIFGTLAVASLAAGAYYLYKNFIKKDSGKDFDDFEDDFEDSDSDDSDQDSREYVPINISPEVNAMEASDESSPIIEEEDDK